MTASERTREARRLAEGGTLTTQEQTTISLDGLDVYIEDAGEAPQPWSPRSTVFKYRVAVEAVEGNYESFAWGSINDYEQGKRTPEEMGWLVLDELLSAAYDPDEFFSMATAGRRRTPASEGHSSAD